MTEATPNIASEHRIDTEDANPRGQGRRLRQRLEWERAFFAAHNSAQAARITPAAAGPDRPPAAGAIQATASASPESGPVAAQRDAATRHADAPGAQPVTPAGSAVVTTTPSARSAGGLTTPAAAGRAIVAPQPATSAPRPAPAALPRPAPASGQAAEPIGVQIHQADGQVRMSLRDARLPGEAGSGFVRRLRGLFTRLGLALEALTLNGKTLFDHAKPAPAPTPETDDDDLDMFV